jgi:hypothetical protein
MSAKHTPEENEADARLIAAAPELLEALKNLLRVEESWCSLNEMCNRGDLDAAMEKARAAIAKAEGESK